jgi:hypothetical protein
VPWSVPGTQEEVPAVRIESPPATMTVPPKPASGSVKRNQPPRCSVQEPIHDSEYSGSESDVSTPRTAPKIGSDYKKVSHTKRRRIRSICKKLKFSVTFASG